MGLQKKRYNDGFYYYGIIEKHPTSIVGVRDDKPIINIIELEKKRCEEISNIYSSRKIGDK